LGSLLRVDELDHIINSEDSDGGLGSELERLDLGHSGLEHTSLQVVAGLSGDQIETRVDQVSFLSVGRVGLLGSVVEHAKLGNQVGGVLGGVHSESFWDD